MGKQKKISEDLVAVSFGPEDIYLRRAGKDYYNDEKCVVKIEDGKLYVNTEALKGFGIELSTDPRPFKAEKLCADMIPAGLYLSCYSETYDLAEKAYDNWVADGCKGELMDYAKAAYKEVRGEEADT